METIVPNQPTPLLRLDAEGRVLLWCEKCQAEHLGPILIAEHEDQQAFKSRLLTRFLLRLQQAETEVVRLRAAARRLFDVDLKGQWRILSNEAAVAFKALQNLVEGP